MRRTEERPDTHFLATARSITNELTLQYIRDVRAEHPVNLTTFKKVTISESRWLSTHDVHSFALWLIERVYANASDVSESESSVLKFDADHVTSWYIFHLWTANFFFQIDIAYHK